MTHNDAKRRVRMTHSDTKRGSGGSRNSERGFPLVVDARHRGLGAQPPDAE